MINRNFWRVFPLAVAVSCVLLVPTTVQAQTQTPAAAQIPVEHFFQHGSFHGAVLSPNGRHIAMRIAEPGGYTMLVVSPVGELKPQVLVKAKSDVEDLRWANNNRLVFSFSDHDVGQGDTYVGGGLFAVNLDGSNLRTLATRQAGLVANEQSSGVPPLSYNTALNTSLGQQDSDTIFVNQYSSDLDNEFGISLLRLNTVTGRSQAVMRPGRVVQWLLDEKGEPRLAVTQEGKMLSTQYLDPATQAWRVLFSFDSRDTNLISPSGFGSDGKLYVYARNGQDKQSLYTYDIAGKKLSHDPVVTMTDYDFTGRLLFKGNKVAGVIFETDAYSTLWFDEKLKAVQARIDALLPNTTNLLNIGRRSETPYVLVNSFSDTEPGVTYLYNTDTNKLTPLGKKMPAIDPKLMAEKNMVHYKARDGLVIPAYLTLPNVATQKNLPMVVMVHGGPYVRGGHWAWSRETQFLASRGYVVLEPEFRGSTGYGHKLFYAGVKQWGLKMQDDIADSVRWAIAQGVADPKRICIAGASYGGYATLMGLMNDPDLYRCGIDWVGVTDINMLYEVHWSDSSASWKAYGMPALVGDPVKDAAQLKATSPLVNAARIKQPLILAYGAADRRVPLIHGTEFRDAVRKTNQNVDWVVYAGEGHGWRLLQSNVDFWTRVEKFLDTYIGKDRAQ